MAPVPGELEEYPVLLHPIRLTHLPRIYQSVYKQRRMYESALLHSQCRLLRRWFTEDALSTYALLLSLNMVLVYVVYWMSRVSTLWVRHIMRRRKGRNFIYNLDECPICLNHFIDPVRLPCAHVHCLECLTNYCRVMGHGIVIRCSLCRRPITDVRYLEGYTRSTYTKAETCEMLEELRLWLGKQLKKSFRSYVSPALYTIFLFILEVTFYYNYCVALEPPF